MEFDFSQIRIEEQQIVQKLGIDAADAVGRIAWTLYSAVNEISPVDTGRFRASWRVSENTPDLSVTPPHDGHESEGTELPPNPFPLDLSSLPEYPVVFLTNGLPYALRLEEGYSKKAGSGVLKVALAQEGLS